MKITVKATFANLAPLTVTAEVERAEQLVNSLFDMGAITVSTKPE